MVVKPGEGWLQDAATALASDLSLDAVLHRLVALAVEITGARYGALGVIGPDGAIQDFITVGVSAEQRAAIGDLPEGHGILGLLIKDPRPLRLAVLHDHPASAGFPPNNPPMTSFLGAPVQARGRVYGNLYLTEKQGRPEFSEEDERALVLLAAHAGTAIGNARAYEESQQRGRWLDAIREIATRILSEADPRETLMLVAARARTLVGGDVSAVASPTQDEGVLRIVAADGGVADDLLGMEVPVEGSVSGTVIRSGKPAVFADATAAVPVHYPMVSAGRMGPAVFVPLSIRGTPIGTLVVARHPGGARFTGEDTALLESFADQAALTLEYGRAQEERRRLVLVEDRERIAKDLHDGVIQLLFAVGMGLEGTVALVADERIAARIHAATSEIDRAISELRSYIFGLRPGVMARQSLGEALDQLAHEFETRSGVTTVVDTDPFVEEALAPQAGHIVQIVRESLSNVAKHANAATCRLSIRLDGDHAVLEIDDDGDGFDPEVASRGMGLPNLRGRAAEMGADLSIATDSREGTTVRLRIPVAPAEEL